MTSCPAPRATPQQAAGLRKDLEASGWGVDAVAHLLGRAADNALRREISLPARRSVRRALADDRAAGATPSPVAVLTALFMLGEPVAARDLDTALRRTRTAGALAMGLVEDVDAPGDAGDRTGCGSAPERCVRALVDLRPHESGGWVGPAPDPAVGPGAPGPEGPGAPATVRWWVASDLGEFQTRRPLEPDHVLGIGGAGLTLARLTPRSPVGTALDLGCGCGIQTLYLLQHCRHVVATDVSARALDFTAFNAALAGVAPERLELVRGSLLEPVARRRFDLVVTNPPFVITPDSVRRAGLPLMEYRDAGRPVVPELLVAMGEHLEVGGTAVMLGNWEHRGGEDWRDDVASWLPVGTDAWVIARERQDPVEYATMWLRDGGITPEHHPELFEAALGAWIEDLQERQVEAVGFGYVIVHRPDPASDGARREPWRVMEEVVTSGQGSLGAHVARSVEVRSGLAAMGDDDVAALRPVVAPDVTEERHLRPGQADPEVIVVRQGGGFGRAVQVSAAQAALVEVADGELSVAQVATAVASLTGADERALLGELVAATRRLAADGFLELTG